MSENLRLTLPVELLTIISSLVRKADLPSLALANKRMNQITTPYLYTELDLFTYGSARHCLIVLNLPPVTLPFPGRVLAECIQSFRLRITCFQYNPGTTDNVEMLGLLLARIMPRMVNLRKLDIGPWSLTSAALVLKALVTHPYPRLQSAQLCLFSPTRNAAATDNLAALVPLSYSQHPPLQTLAVTSLSSLSQHNHAHLCALLSSTAGSLQRLSLKMEKTADLRAVFPVNATFPVLEHLEVTVRDFNDPICTALTHIRSLAIKSQGLVITPPGPVLTTAYPVLEELACMHSQVALFLGPDIHPRRPVHTVELDYTKYERNGGETTEDTPRWKDVLFAFEHLQFSAVPIRHLRFYVNRLLIPALQVAMSEFPSLESLTMVVWHEPKRVRAQSVPHAHSVALPTLMNVARMHCLRWANGSSLGSPVYIHFSLATL